MFKQKVSIREKTQKWYCSTMLAGIELWELRVKMIILYSRCCLFVLIKRSDFAGFRSRNSLRETLTSTLYVQVPLLKALHSAMSRTSRRMPGLGTRWISGCKG